MPSRTDTSQSCDADHYAVLKPSAEDSAEYLACMDGGMQFWQAGRGIPLRSRWNDEWEFVIDTSFRHPKGIGDLAEMNRLIAVRARGYAVLKPLIGYAAEILKGCYKGAELWLFNVTRHVTKAQIGALDDAAIFASTRPACRYSAALYSRMSWSEAG